MMTAKPVIISSSGLKNIVLSKYQEEDDFVFIFGDQEIRMKSFFAEFISPVVSNIHKSDPTINCINLGEMIKTNKNNISKLSKSLLTADTISLLQQISSGSSVELDESQAIKIRILSTILGNEELRSKMNELFPTNYSEDKVNIYMKNLESFYHFSKIEGESDISNTVSFIASHFYAVDFSEFLKVPIFLQYKIISHKDLRIENEDSLFDIVKEIIENKNKKREIDDILFLEEIEIEGLSESKFIEFLSLIDINDMSCQLWQNLCQRFYNSKARNKHSFKQKDKQKMCLLFVSGVDKCNQLDEKPNNKNEDGFPIISPPLNLTIDPSSLKSYSVYCFHSVQVTSDSSLKGIGYNEDGRITSSLEKTSIDHFTDFYMKDGSDPVSAVCCGGGTLYMFSKMSGGGRQLVLCDKDIKGGDPVFLDIGNHHPVSLFGGNYHSATICSEGEVIFINRKSVKKSPEKRIESVSLPNGEKESSVACCIDTVFVLSSNGRVFWSPVSDDSVLKFSEVSELSGKEIVCVSGTFNHVLAVSKEGRVFGLGSNSYGQLGVGEGIKKALSFIEISSLLGYEIRAAYAGGCHSLFETREGKILSCGNNKYGELLLSSGPGGIVYSPTETMIKRGATFCIAGNCLSVVFTGSKPPPNTPNTRIQQYK